MDNNQYQNFSEARPTRAADFRRIARQRLKGFWWTAALVTLVAALLGGVIISAPSFSINAPVFDDSMYDESVDEDVTVGEGEEEESEEEEPLLTEDQEDQFIEAFQKGDYNRAGEILFGSNSIFSAVLTAIGIILAVALIFGLAFEYFLSSPIKVGYRRFFLRVIDGDAANIRVGTLFDSFKCGYGKTIGLNFMHNLIQFLTMIPFYIFTFVGMGIFFRDIFSTVFIDNPDDEAISRVFVSLFVMLGLMMLGLLISSLINLPISYAYSMSHSIMADYPGVGVFEALRLSRQMMKGNKWRLFCLDFSFIGWHLLGAITCGLGNYFVTPYQYAAHAAFYNEISGRNASEDVEFPSINPDDYIF